MVNVFLFISRSPIISPIIYKFDSSSPDIPTKVFEVVAVANNSLLHFFINLDEGKWARYDDNVITKGVMGTPAFIQGTWGFLANYNWEVVVPLVEGGLQHFYRKNDQLHQPWVPSYKFGGQFGKFCGAALIQSNYGDDKNNFEVVARLLAVPMAVPLFRRIKSVFNSGPGVGT